VSLQAKQVPEAPSHATKNLYNALARFYFSLLRALAAELRAGDYEELAEVLHNQDARFNLDASSSLPEWTRENFHLELSTRIYGAKAMNNHPPD
jgi:hypothetical protein